MNHARDDSKNRPHPSDDGTEMPAFVATKNELLQLAQYWATEMIKLDFRFFLLGQSGTPELRIRQFATRRLDAIRNLIGSNEVTYAHQEATRRFAKNVDMQTWKVFTKGTPKEKLRFQDEVLQRMLADSGNG